MNPKKTQLEMNVLYYESRLSELEKNLATCNDGRIRASEDAEIIYWRDKEIHVKREIEIAQEELKQSQEILEELNQTI